MRARTIGVLLALPPLFTAACGRGSDERMTAPPGRSGPVDPAGYLAPPEVVSATVARDGALRLTGRAPPRSVVELVSPEGADVRQLADRRGGWSARLPGGRPHLYALSATVAGRAVHADGGLVTAPGALAAAVMVRAGGAARPILRPGGFGLATVDYDGSGVTAAAGGAPPGAPLALLVDGAPAASGQADASGRYALIAANRRLGFGPHRLEVRGPAGARAIRTVVLSPPVPLTAPYQAQPMQGGGWRVDWALTGGGEQATLILPP